MVNSYKIVFFGSNGNSRIYGILSVFYLLLRVVWFKCSIPNANCISGGRRWSYSKPTAAPTPPAIGRRSKTLTKRGAFTTLGPLHEELSDNSDPVEEGVVRGWPNELEEVIFNPFLQSKQDGEGVGDSFHAMWMGIGDSFYWKQQCILVRRF